MSPHFDVCSRCNSRRGALKPNGRSGPRCDAFNTPACLQTQSAARQGIYRSVVSAQERGTIAWTAVSPVLPPAGEIQIKKIR